MDLEKKRQLLKALEQKEKLQSEYLRNWKGSLIQEAAICSTAKIVMVSGGNQSGKSESGGVRIGICSTGIIPKSLEDKFPKQLIRHGDYWCSALDYAGARDIIKEKLDVVIPSRLVNRYSKEDKIYYLNNELGRIGLKSEESGRGKYQGVQRLGVWPDEEHTKEVWDELFERVTRLRGFLFFTFSPIEGLTWSYDELYKKAGKIVFTKNKHGIKEEVGVVHTPEEIEKLRDRELQCEVREGDKYNPNIEVYIISKYDNPYLHTEEIINSEQKYKDDPAQYQSRILGRYAKITNNCAFNQNALLKMQSKCPSTYLTGDIVRGQFQLDPKGNLKIFKQKQLGRHYVIGADIAQGTDNGDFSCAQILDHKTCEQVAIWHGKVHPEKFASILIELGKYFNTAILAPERNFHGFGVVNRIRDQKYKRLFSEYDQTQQTVNVGGAGGTKKYGWETTAKTRPILVQDLATFISQEHIIINDAETIDECLTFVYDKENKAQAMKGCFDDRVMALGIALQVFQLKSIPRIEIHTPTKNTTDSFGYPC